MPAPTLEFAPPRDDDEYQRFIALAGRALLVPEKFLAQLREQEGAANVRVARRDGVLAGGLSVQRMGQWFGGRSVPVGAVRMVATAPEFRGQGVASRLLAAAHLELHEDGVSLGALYPATHVLYRRAGYELAGSRLNYRLPIASLPRGGDAGDVERVSLASKQPFAAEYDERARQTNGNLDRNDWMWRRVLSSHRDELEGYTTDGGNVIFSAGRVDGSQDGGILAKQFVARTPRAAATLLRLLRAHATMVVRVTLPAGPGDALFCLLDNPSYEVASRSDWMLRLIDVERALAQRGYAAALRAELHLEVRDDGLAWNHGRFVLEVADGEATVRKGGRGEIAIDVRGLASAYSGFLTPHELRAAGYLEAPPEALDRLASVFAGPPPWMPDGF